MSDVWSDGYFIGLNYTHGYYRETAPSFQRFCLLLRGLTCGGADEPVSHCELGFGQGVSVAINAASNPGSFVATDFNPAHAANARAMASHSGANLRVLDDSFEQMLARDDLPDFDSISLHGVWSWVSDENRHAITRFAARHLKPGGVLYISYNCFPGCAAAAPLRHVLALHDRYAPAAAEPTQRIDAALGFAGALLDAKPLFAHALPGLADRLAQMAGMSRDYLAHEYFNRDWRCMYFTEVADALTAAKLDFATTAEPLELVDAVNLTAAATAFLNAIGHPLQREQIRDYFLNRAFRKDLWLRGARRLPAAAMREQTLATRILLQRPLSAIPLTVAAPLGSATLDSGLFRPLLDELAARDHAPKSFADLARALPDFDLPRLVSAAAILTGTGHAAPCQPEAAEQQTGATCAALNRHLLDRARTSDEVHHLASPVIGGGIAVGRFQQLFLLARGSGLARPGEWARFTWQLLADQGQQVLKDGKPLNSPDESLAELGAHARAFATEELPILRAAGVA